MSLDLSGPTIALLTTLGIAAVLFTWNLLAFVVILLVAGTGRAVALLVSPCLRVHNLRRHPPEIE